MTERLRLLLLVVPVLAVGALVARFAWSQSEEETVTEAPTAVSVHTNLPEQTEYCVSPEEMAVIEKVRRRHWELQQREELLAVQELAVRDMHREIRQEVQRLGSLRTAIEDLLEARKTARREGGDALVRMVDQMKPAEAADMLSLMDPLLAAAVIERLSPRQAGRILGSMEPDTAAKLGGSLAIDPIEAVSQEGGTP